MWPHWRHDPPRRRDRHPARRLPRGRQPRRRGRRPRPRGVPGLLLRRRGDRPGRRARGADPPAPAAPPGPARLPPPGAGAAPRAAPRRLRNLRHGWLVARRISTRSPDLVPRSGRSLNLAEPTPTARASRSAARLSSLNLAEPTPTARASRSAARLSSPHVGGRRNNRPRRGRWARRAEESRLSGMSGMGQVWRHMRTDRSAVANRVDRQTVRRVFASARPHRRLIAVFLGLTVVDACLVVVTPLLVRRIVDDGILQKDTRLVVTLATVMALVALFDAALGVVSGWLSSRIGEGLIYDLRTQVFAHVQRQTLAFFTRTQTGALVSRLNNDVIGAQRAFTSTLQGTVSNIISAVVVGVTMMFLSWQVTLLCLALFPLLLIASRAVGNRLAGLSREQMDGNADLGNAMTERFNVGGAMLLKLFGRREEEDVVYAEKAAVVRDLGVRIALLTRIFFAAMTLVPQLAVALVYGIGGYLAIRGDLSIGTIVALGVLLLRLLGP